MTNSISSLAPPLFDFFAFDGQSEHHVALLRQFSAALPFRSASVDELVLDGDYHRRALRPEDLAFLKFRKPVRHDNVSRSPALASNRTLLSIYELDVMRGPRSPDTDDWARFTAFYQDETRTPGARLLPFLEAYAFSYLSTDVDTSEDIDVAAMRLTQLVRDESTFWQATFARLMRRDYLEEGLRFIVVQRWALQLSKRRALACAGANGFFDMLPPEERPSLRHTSSSDAQTGTVDDALFERVAQASGVAREQHAYWQFYLPTSLATCNLLYALARRPDRAFALVGAGFAAEAQWLAFGLALQAACPHLQPAAMQDAQDGEATQHASIHSLGTRFSRAMRRCEEVYGDAAHRQCLQGLIAGERLAERGRWDLGEQLQWLSAIPEYVKFAHRIGARIDAECPDIDRETFVESREMCATTHVHNDHRLVTIEKGDMQFWGNVGTRFDMRQGDKVLIPDGRLHGSTVTSDECTYHQPIIPDAWVDALAAELDS